MGKRNVRTAAWAWTDDLGEYRVAPILAGTYYIAVTGQPWYSQAQAPKMQGSVAEAFGYAPVYYSNTADAGRAAALVVVPGQEATADFAVSPVPGVTLRVTCDGPPVTKTLRLINDGILGSESVPRTVPMPLNAATLVGVPAGRYFVDLMSTAGGSILVARQAIEIGGVDADVQLKLVPPAAVTGTVTWDSPASTPRGSLLVRLIRSNFEATFPAAVRADGSFQIPAVLAGAYEVAIYSKGNRLAAQIHSEAVASDGLLHADNGADINVRITVSDQVGGVKGLVIQDGQPAPGVFAVLMPRRERLLPGDSRAYQTDSDGSFNWQDIPAGDYFLFATRDTQLEYSNPAVLQPFLPEAKLVHVDLHGTLNERIPLADTGNTKR